MSLLDFTTVKDYSGMLNRITLFTLSVSVGCLVLLEKQVPWIATVLSKIPDFALKLGDTETNIPLRIFIPAVIVAVLARMFKLHDRVSDILKIRQRFDCEHILNPMASSVLGTVSAERTSAISERREPLMTAVFYKYASSRADTPAIDRHLIEMALDQWSWYWVVVESAVLLLLTGTILVTGGHFALTAAILIVLCLSLWVMESLKSRCAAYASEEIAAILDDNDRRQAIRNVFDALPG